MRNLYFVYTKRNILGPPQIINYPDRGPELGSSIWWKCLISGPAPGRRLGLWKKSGPKMGSEAPGWPKMYQKWPKRRSDDTADSIVKPMENEESAKRSKNKINDLIKKPYKTLLKMRFGIKMDIQLDRFYCKTNGKWETCEKRDPVFIKKPYKTLLKCDFA